MFKCIKWAVIGLAAAGGISWFAFGDNLFSYVSTMAGSFRESVKGQVPVEFELKRAEQLVRDIDPQITKCKRDLAQAEVNLDNLRGDVERLGRDVEKGERKLKEGTAILVAASPAAPAEYQLASTRLPRARFELDLDRTFQEFKNKKDLLRGKSALIESQSRAVAAARERLDAVRSERSRLEDMIGTLKTQKMQVDALAASSKSFTLDDSALGRAKNVLAEVKNRLDIAQKMIADELFFCDGEVPVAVPGRDVVGEIRKYFAESQDVATTIIEEEPVRAVVQGR